MAANKRKILEAARKHAQKGAKDRALKEYEKLLKLDPRDAKLRLEVGDAHRRWGQADEAIAAYTKVAEQYTKEGFDARAVAVYKQIVNLDPARFSAYEPLAELYQRMSLTAEAIHALQTAAEGYQRDGQKRAALELLRKMATIDPTDTTSRIKVAELLRQEELFAEAVAEYAEVADELEGRGEAEEAAAVFEKVIELEPDHVPTILRLARNLTERGQESRAEPFARRALECEPYEPEHYELLAGIIHSQGRNEECADLYRKLADIYRGRGDEERAREIIQRFVPLDSFGTRASAQASASPEDSLDESVLDQPSLEDLVHDTGDHAKPALPDDPLLTDELVVGSESDGLFGPTENDLSGPLPELELDQPIDVEEPATPTAAPVAAPTVLASSDPEQLLAEASVYLRYGKRDQAIAHLQTILSLAPDHRPALEKLGEAQADAGEPEAAVETWMRAAVRAREEDDAEGLEVLRGRIAMLDPEAAAELKTADEAAPAPMADAGLTRAIDIEPGSQELDLGEVEIDVDVPDLDTDFDLGETGSGATDEPVDLGATGPDLPASDDLAEQTASSDDSEAPTMARPNIDESAGAQLNSDLEEADFYLEQGLLDEAEALYRRVLAIAPGHPHVLLRLGEIEASRGEDPGVGDGPAPVASAAAVASPSASPELTMPSFDVTDPSERAPEPVTDPGESIPDLSSSPEPEPEPEPDPVEPALAAAHTPDETPAPEPTAPEADDVADTEAVEPAPPGDLADEWKGPGFGDADANPDDSFDLAAELSDVLDADAGNSSGNLSDTSDDGFASVLSDFKKGVSRTLGETDHQARWDLGIAYREMGLLEDAIGEFALAMESGERRIDCLHMLGLCSLELGRPDESIGHLERGLADATSSPGQRLAMRYALGQALEANGDRAGARTAFECVEADNADFCDVRDRIAALDASDDSASTPADSEAASGSESQDFESFEDVIGEAESTPLPEDGVTEEYESLADVVSEAEAEAEAERDEAHDDAPASPDAPADPDPPRRRKKISFF